VQEHRNEHVNAAASHAVSAELDEAEAEIPNRYDAGVLFWAIVFQFVLRAASGSTDLLRRTTALGPEPNNA
jgi:hypothetical protein